MRKDLLTIALLLAAGVARADVLSVPEGDPTPQIVLPAKGLSMAEVQKGYGDPRQKRPTVGGDSPKHPPITRWDYDAFSVIFERDKVVDAVVPGAPPKIFNRDELKPTVVYVPADAAMPAAAESEESMPAEAIPMPAPVQTSPEGPAPVAPMTPPPAPAAEPVPPAEPSRDSRTSLPTPK